MVRGWIIIITKKENDKAMNVKKIKCIALAMVLSVGFLSACYDDYSKPRVVTNYPSGSVVDSATTQIEIKGEVQRGEAIFESLCASVEGVSDYTPVSFITPSDNQFSYTANLGDWGNSLSKTICFKMVDLKGIATYNRIAIYRGNSNAASESITMPVNIGEEFFSKDIKAYVKVKVEEQLAGMDASDFMGGNDGVNNVVLGRMADASVTLSEREPGDQSSGINVSLRILGDNNGHGFEAYGRKTIWHEKICAPPFDWPCYTFTVHADWSVKIDAINIGNIGTALSVDGEGKLAVSLDFTNATVRFTGVTEKVVVDALGIPVDVSSLTNTAKNKVEHKYADAIRGLGVKNFNNLINVNRSFSLQGMDIALHPVIITTDSGSTVSYSVRSVTKESDGTAYRFMTIPLTTSLTVPDGYFMEQLNHYKKGSFCAKAPGLPVASNGLYGVTTGEDLILPINEEIMNAVSYNLYQTGKWDQKVIEITDAMKEKLGSNVSMTMSLTSPPIVDFAAGNLESRLVVNNLQVDLKDITFNYEEKIEETVVNYIEKTFTSIIFKKIVKTFLIPVTEKIWKTVVKTGSVDISLGVDLDVRFNTEVNADGTKFIFNINRERSSSAVKLLYVSIPLLDNAYHYVEPKLNEYSSAVLDMAYDKVNEFLPSLTGVNIEAMNGMFNPIKFIYSDVNSNSTSECTTPYDRLFIKLKLGL